MAEGKGKGKLAAAPDETVDDTPDDVGDQGDGYPMVAYLDYKMLGQEHLAKELLKAHNTVLHKPEYGGGESMYSVDSDGDLTSLLDNELHQRQSAALATHSSSVVDPSESAASSEEQARAEARQRYKDFMKRAEADMQRFPDPFDIENDLEDQISTLEEMQGIVASFGVSVEEAYTEPAEGVASSSRG